MDLTFWLLLILYLTTFFFHQNRINRIGGEKIKIRKLIITKISKQLFREAPIKSFTPDAYCIHPLSSDKLTIAIKNQMIIFLFRNNVIGCLFYLNKLYPPPLPVILSKNPCRSNQNNINNMQYLHG